MVAAWSQERQASESRRQLRVGAIVLGVMAVIIFAMFEAGLPKELFLLAGMIALVGLLWLASGLLIQRRAYQNGFVEIMTDLLGMPQTMQQLAVVQFFTWFALFSMWLYTTAGVTAHIYGTSDTTSVLYNEGADWVGVCFAVYNGVAALVAFGLPWLAKMTNRRVAHLICLVLGGIGLLSIYFIKDPNLIMVSMVGVGIAWASILSMPYAMLAGALPANKMGYYMGVFNFFIVIPQLVAATILGFMLGRFFGDQAIYALVVGGISMILAGVLTLRVNDVDDPEAVAA